MLKKRWTAIVVAAGIAGVLFVSGCKHPGCGRFSLEKRMDKAISKMTDRLILDENQVVLLNGIKEKCLAHKKEMMPEHEKFGDEIIAQINSEEFDREHVKKMVQGKITQKEELILLLIDEAADFHSTLSDTQKSELVDMISELREKHRKYFQP